VLQVAVGKWYFCRMPIRPAPPRSEGELWSRARDLAGLSLAHLAVDDAACVPDRLLHAKGWLGQLLKRRLGANAGSKDEPDFQALGIELKTLPVDRVGRPCESTFVCTIPLLDVAGTEWADSRVKRKLNRVLFMIVEGSRDIPVARRRIGEPLLWSPNESETALLKHDWDELTGIIGRGDIESITGHLGQAMQVRPKARDSRARRRGLDEDGVVVARMPRGFYLRATFTGGILRRSFVLPR
jgi:DNA mismatch repair protein MutH